MSERENMMCLEKILTPTKTSSAERLNRIEQLRSTIKHAAFSAEEIEQAINSGRP